MQNQDQFQAIVPDEGDLGAVGGGGSSWWQTAGAALDLGMFFSPGGTNQVHLNAILRGWLDAPEVIDGDQDAFWDRLSSLADHPQQAARGLRVLRDTYPEQRLVQFPVREEPGVLSLLFFQSGESASSAGSWGGFVIKETGPNPLLPNLVKVFDALLVPARQLTAAIQGNLGALTGNLQIWSPDVLEQFLGTVKEDSNRLRQYLDLGLSYSKILDQTTLFSQPVSLANLLETIITEQGYTAAKVHQLGPEGENPLLANIDPALIKVALETLLGEVVDQSPPGQHLELRVTKQAGNVLLKVDSPKMLPLPGFVPDPLHQHTPEAIRPEFYLVKEILTALGGDLMLEPRLSEAGGGLDIAVSLPAFDQSQDRPDRQDWRELFGTGAGRILVAEAQPEIQIGLRDALSEIGFRVDLASDGNSVLDMVQTRQPNLIILARDLPGMDGLLLTQGVRRWSAIPILMLSGRESVDDRLYAYRLGVDDYIQKPFVMEELLAKVQVFLSRQEAASQSLAPELYQAGSIRIDYGTRQVWVKGNLVQLTPIEYNLLVYLSRQGRQIIPYGQLLEHVWEGPEKGTRQGLFVHVRRLREKIEDDPKQPKIITNKWGVGYEFHP